VFFTFFRTAVSQKQFEISKCAYQVKYWKFNNLQIWIFYIVSISWTVFEAFRKNSFWKNFFRFYGFLKRLDLGQITLWFFFPFFFYCWESSLLWTAQFGNIAAKLGVGLFSRYFEPLHLKNCWTYQNEHGSIRSSSAPFLIFDVRTKKEEKNNGFDRNVILMPRLDLENFLASRDMADSEKWLLSEIGASIENMCIMKNASFFLNLSKRKLHVEISPDL